MSATQLSPARVDEIRHLHASLVSLGEPESVQDASKALHEAHRAIADLLVERAALVAASEAVAEELALWTGSV